MMTSKHATAEILRVVGKMADTFGPDFDNGFWADVVEPIAELIVRLRGRLTDDDRALLMAVAANAVRASQREQEAYDAAGAAIRKAGERK